MYGLMPVSIVETRASRYEKHLVVYAKNAIQNALETHYKMKSQRWETGTMQTINLNNFAQGALAEKVNIELQKAFENMADPNTDHKKARKVIVTIEMKPSENREIVSTHISTKSQLVPAKSVETQIFLDYAGKKVVGKELHSGVVGQSFITDDGEIKTDTGEDIEEAEKQATKGKKSNKVVSFK